MRDLPNTSQVKVTQITTATTTAALAAPGVGKRIRVFGMRLSAAAAQAITLKDGSTAKETFNLVAGVPHHLPLRAQPYYTLAENAALNLDSTTTGPTDVVIEYDIS